MKEKRFESKEKVKVKANLATSSAMMSPQDGSKCSLTTHAH